MKFLTRYPTPLYKGKVADWYFVSRLTRNENYSNTKPGDRTLAIFLGKEEYAFATENGDNPNVSKSIKVNDVEGLWTYVYFSYSVEKSSAVAFLQFA